MRFIHMLLVKTNDYDVIDVNVFHLKLQKMRSKTSLLYYLKSSKHVTRRCSLIFFFSLKGKVLLLVGSLPNVIRTYSWKTLLQRKRNASAKSYIISDHLRVVFASNAVGVEVVIKSVELYDLLKTPFWFFWFRLRLRRVRSSEGWVVGVANKSGRSKPITKRENVHCDWFILPLLLPTPTIGFH